MRLVCNFLSLARRFYCRLAVGKAEVNKKMTNFNLSVASAKEDPDILKYFLPIEIIHCQKSIFVAE